ncbi:Cd(II)/Pb(II)-responsive transcriptional regulator [Thiomonas sp.]|jgi:Cd(II)/Pb(II)-responsive transcriptional regulator|uniref:Cd(II)/Pb(II)-responsive transcriptional regulator n=1 Tax=Thiomonas sp. TaxID=2047785 RepID=UPI00260BD0CD|nr:Cd(II)/Pb(II)-responsive transcriptional regulator [Thiomonas sp.]
MRIGELSRTTSTSVETIRYYEREGLLETPARTSGNFRVYHAGHRERLQFIRFCRGLDMSLDEVRLLLRLRDAPGQDCGDVNALLDEHLAQVSQRLRELRMLQQWLRELRGRCVSPSQAGQCGILRGLEQASRAAPGVAAAAAADGDDCTAPHSSTSPWQR